MKWLSWDSALFVQTFVMIFLAEMGDKTQLMAMTQAGQSGKLLTVLLAAVLALAAVTVLGVLVGGVLSNWLPEVWLKRGAGGLFVVLGVLMLAGRL